MKRLLFLSCFISLIVSGLAQERTIILNSGQPYDLLANRLVTWSTSSAIDRLIPTTRDTIDIVLLVKNQGANPLNFYATVTMSPIAGADTTVAITVQQKMFENQSYQDLISSALTSAITTANVVTVKTTLGVSVQKTNTTAGAVDLFRGSNIKNNDTLTVASRVQTIQLNPLLYYRYLKFRLILSGNDHVGTGIQLNRIDINFFN